jgi:hypothetical protein
VLLFVPVALMSRRLSPLWIAMLALWLDAQAWSRGNAMRIAPVLVFASVVVAVGAGARLRLRRQLSAAATS